MSETLKGNYNLHMNNTLGSFCLLFPVFQPHLTVISGQLCSFFEKKSHQKLYLLAVLERLIVSFDLHQQIVLVVIGLLKLNFFSVLQNSY